jgi:hypothetical protein
VKQKLLGQENLRTLQPLIAGKYLSENMGRKIAFSGLAQHHIKLSYDRDGHDGHGIKNLFTEKTDGQVRVTNRTNIISSFSQFFKDSDVSNK